MHRNFQLAISLFACVLSFSCSKISNIPANTDISLTYYDTAINFSKYSTFLLRDSVAFISDDPQNTEFIKSNGISSIVPQIASELLQLGFRQVDTISKADIAINILITNTEIESLQDLSEWTEKQNINNYLEWYSGGQPVWGDFSGFWYPWTYHDIKSNAGLLLIEFVDGASIRKLIDQNDNSPNDTQLKFLWQAIITGISQNGVYDAQKTSNYIEEAFIQSPYLQK